MGHERGRGRAAWLAARGAAVAVIVAACSSEPSTAQRGASDGADDDDGGATSSADASRTDDGSSQSDALADAGVVDDGGGPEAGDAGSAPDAADAADAADGAPAAHSLLRIGGTCMAQCKGSAPPDGGAFATEDGAPCVMPRSDVALASPFCEAPVPAPPATVTDATMAVATLPRPAAVVLGPDVACPDQRTDLEPYQAVWASAGIIDIPVGKKVLVRGNTDLPAATLIKRLTVPQGSELVFADQPTTLRVRDLVVDGKLWMGASTCRFKSALELAFDTDEDVSQPTVRSQIHSRGGLGLVVGATGTLEMHGKLHQPTWTRLALTANAGATSLTLAEPVDWIAGQKVVVATSAVQDYPLANENEVRTVTGVTGGTQLALDAPLTFKHYGGPEYQVEVGLLSRNIVLRTADAVRTTAPTFGGHVMGQGAMHVSGVELRGLGQQNFLGRYPMHFHMMGDVGGQSYFTDSSVWQSNWRCAVIHRTDRSIVSRNVAFDAFGHCFYLEDGAERGNEISFNLAIRPKILGPTDSASITALNDPLQTGFTLKAAPDMIQPADRAAAGYYISNGSNQVFGNAASGGFAAYSFPNLPKAIGAADATVPLAYPISHFDGNTAHSAGYMWRYVGCVYVGGALQTVDDGSGPKLQYQVGRTFGNLLRNNVDQITNTKAFLCEVGVTHWGNGSALRNVEVWDSALLANLFGGASIESSLVAGSTGHTASVVTPLSVWRRGFQFYDTWTLTTLNNVLFRGFHWRANHWPNKSGNDCALVSMTHSDQYTPQRMSATAGIHYADVDASQRICHDDSGTLSSRNFNIIDTDGTATARAGDGLPAGPRLIGSGYIDTWKTSSACVKQADWGIWACPLTGAQNVASVAVTPNKGVTVSTYDVAGASLGQNWYTTAASYDEAQITGPSGVGWHHAFPGGVPDTFDVYALQVPVGSFVLLSLTLPAGVSCSVADAGWSAAANLSGLLAATTPKYLTHKGACLVRIPAIDAGTFTAAGLSIPRQAWRGMSTANTFKVTTGCSAGIPACKTVPSVLPTMN